MSASGKYFIVVAGFLGWLFAGTQLGVSSLVMRPAVKDLLNTENEALIGQWFGWLIAAFLLGAATGGYLFGWLGDRLGRKGAMALSIAFYSAFSGLTYFVQEPWQLLVLRFLTCMGVGGMWPNGIALVSEAWPGMSRPFLAGVIGTAANVGIMLFSLLLWYVHVTPDDWRWAVAIGAIPIVLSIFVLMFVPESPKWLALRDKPRTSEPDKAAAASPLIAIFFPPLLRVTVVGILLGTIPLFGGWGSTNWANAWASQIGDAKAGSSSPDTSQAKPDPGLKARILLARSAPGSVSSLLGGALAVALGRRRCYFLLSLACLYCSQNLFWFSNPGEPEFLKWTAALGFFSGFFFGWLPLCLPELFPTRVRSTGAGVSFNFGRIVTALGILVAAGLLKELFDGDYAKIGRLTSLVYALGLFVIWLAPHTEGKLQD